MARLSFREIKPLKFKELPPETGAVDDLGVADLPDLGAAPDAPAAPPPQPSFGATAVQRAGRIDELTRAEEQPATRQKGRGYLGPLNRPDGRVSTELSIGVNMEGEETEIPTLVPGLTQEEIDLLLTIDDPKDIPQTIIDKAIDHARKRRSAGKNFFAQREDFKPPNIEALMGAKPNFDVTRTLSDIPAMPDIYEEPEGLADLAHTVQGLGQFGATFGKDVLKEFKDVGNLSGQKVNEGLAHFSRNMDSIVEMFTQAYNMVAEPMGLDPIERNEVFKSAAEQYEKGAKWWKDRAKDPSFLAEVTGTLLGGSIPAIGEFLLDVPYFILLGLSRGGVKEGLTMGLERFLLGHILHSAGFLKFGPRVTTTASIGALQAAAMGGTKEDIIKGGMVMGALGATMGPGRVGLREALRDVPFGVMEDATALHDFIYERVRPIIENTKEIGLVDPGEISEWYSTKLATLDSILRDPNGRPVGELRAAADSFKAVTGQQHPLDPDLTGHDPLRQIPQEAGRFTEDPRIFSRPFKFVEVGQVTPIERAPGAAPPEGEGFVMVEPEPTPLPQKGERPTEVKQPTEPILSKEGTPFKTERGAATNIAKARKAHPAIKDWTVVPVEGGFGLQPRHQVAWQQTVEEYTERFYLQGRRFEDIADEEFEGILNESPGMSDFYDPKTTNHKEAVRRYIDDRIELQQEFGGILRKDHPFEKRKDGKPRIQTTTMKHYREVAKAIKAGLPVPSEVLAPYPSLQGKLVPEGVIAPDAEAVEVDEIAEIIPGLLEDGNATALGDLVDIPPGYPEPIIVDPTTIRTDFQNVPTSLRLEEIYTDVGFERVSDEMNAVGDIDVTFKWPTEPGEAAPEAIPFPFKAGDTVQTPSGEGKILSVGKEKARIELIDGTTEAVALGDISTPVGRGEPEIAAEEPEVEIEPVAPVEPEAPIEEAPKAAPIGFDSKGKALRPGDAVRMDKRYPGERMEIVGKHPSRKDIFKVRKEGQKRELNAHSKELIKIIPKMVRPSRGPQRTWKTLIGWFRLNPIWDSTLPGETNFFHVKNSRVGGLVDKARGLPWDELARQALEDGILRKGQTWEDLYEMLVDEIGRVSEGKKGTIVGTVNITAQEQQMDKVSQAAEEEWIESWATEVRKETYGVFDLDVGDKVNVPTAQGDSEWIEVTKKGKEGRVELTDSKGEVFAYEIFDPVEIVGGKEFGIDYIADRVEPKRVALKIEKDQQIPVLNKYEKQLIKIMEKKVKGKYPDTARIDLPQEAVDLIDPELWLSSEVQLQYGMVSDYDRIGWAIQLVQGDNLGDRIYTIQRPYGTLTFDLNNKTLRLDPTYQGVISSSLVVHVDPDMEKERVLRTTLMRNIMKQNPTRTIPNELLQNSLDAMPDARPWDQQVINWRVDGKFDANAGTRSTEITVEDNGIGMAPAIFAFKYLKIGAEGKRSDIAMGGFGAANAALLYFPNKIKVVSVGWAVENEEFTTRMVKGEERVDVRRWEDGRNEDGTVKEGAIKIRTSLKATRDEMFAGLGGRKSIPIKIDLPGDFDPDTPTGTSYTATYSDIDTNNNLEIADYALRSGFKNYVEELRYKAVVIQTGIQGNPDVVTHTKDFSDLTEEELKEPKISVHAKGNSIDIYLLDIGPTGAYKYTDGHEIKQRFYNKGLPLQIRDDNIGEIKRVPFEPDFRFLINFTRTPDVDPKKWAPGEEYPFIENRTELVNKIGKVIANEVNKILDVMIADFNVGEIKDFKQMQKQSPTINGVTTMVPYRSEAEVKIAKALLKKHRPFFRDMSRVFNIFQDLMKEIGQEKINLVLTIDPRLHGWKSNPASDIPELYAINPMSVTKRYTLKDAFQRALDEGADLDALKAYNFIWTMMHEYSHKHVSGHGQPFRAAMGDLFAVFGPLRYAILGREVYGVFKKHSKRIDQLTEDFEGLGEGGLLLTTESGRNKYAEHERGRIKGTSPLSQVGGVFAQSRIQYDLFGEHQKIEGEPEPVTPEDFLKRSFPDASPAQIKAMLADPKLRKQVAQGSLSTKLAEEISKKYNLAKSATQMEMFPGEAKGQGDLFDLSRKEVGEDLDDYAEGLGPEGGSLVFKGQPGKAEGEPFESAEEDVQARVETSRGKRVETLAEAFERKKTDLLNKAFREFQHLPKNKEFAELRNALLKLQKQKGVTSLKMAQRLKEVTKDLNKTDETDFAWKVILDDLMEEVSLQRERGTTEDEIGLPYGYTPETLEVDHIALNRHIDGNAEISAALQRRKDLWNNLRLDYTRAMKVIGFDVSKHLTRDFYFRHQVLHYVNVMGLFGSGERLRTPSYRSHLRPRTGASPDINADYLQAESEVVAQMLYDIEIARTIDSVNRHYNIQDELKGLALHNNDTKMYEFFGALAQTLDVAEGKEPPTAESLYKQILNKKMAIGFDKLGQHAALLELPTGKEYEWEWLTIELADNWLENKAIKKELGKEWTNADRESLSNKAADALIQYAAWILKNHGGEPGSGAAATIFKGMNEKRKIIQETLGDEYLEWRDIIPPGYTTWQPWEGTTFFMAHSVPETIAKQLLEAELEEIGIKADDLRMALTRGGRRREYVVKQEVADTLNELSTPRTRGALGNVHAYAIKRWKIWQLVSPRRFGKYNFRNLTGDAEAAWLGSPAIFKHLKISFHELYQVFVEGKDPAEVSAELNDWLERGGWGATLQAQEMGEFDFTKSFLKRHEKTGVMGIPSKAWNAYWQTARISTDFREALLRYAAYREAMRVMEASPDGMPTEYWASIRDEIQGLSDMRDRAYFMSNDLLGAYDRVSVLGQELRERWFPFWSWKAVNFVRYVRLFQNAAHDGEFTKKLGYKAAGTAAKSPFIAMRIGKMILKMLALQAITFAIANTFFPREEDDLPEEIKGRPHLTFGRDSDGNVQYFPRIGATSDNLEWVGLDATPYYVNQYMRGRMTLPEIAKEMAKSPLNVVIQGGIPFIKLGAELLTRRALFPDAFSPRTVRDRGLHLFRAFGLDNEYLAISGKPSRPYYKSVKGTLIYTIDPFQAGYRDTMDQKTRFMSKIGKLSEGFHLTDRGNALYHARLAMRYNDYDATIKYMAEYLNFGGTLRGLKQSLNNMHPLSGLNSAEKVEFVASLDAEGLAKFVRAVRYWEELVTVAPPEEKRALRLLR
jgi:hypothetical protein